MPIERRLLFENGTAYDIVATKYHVIRLWDPNDPKFPERYLSQIFKALDDMQWCDMVHEYIINPYDGILWPLDIWMAEYGCIDHAMDLLDNGNDAATIGTFDSEDLTIGDENNPIDLTEQRELTDAAHLLSEIRNDVIDLTDMDEECMEQDPEDMNLGWYLYEDAE